MLFQVSTLIPLLGMVFSSAIPPNLPAFCHELDCPQFTVLETTADYEVRHYEATKWVTVHKEGATRDEVNNDLFMTLFHYIAGSNANHTKIAMTAPVLTKVTHGPGPNCESNFSMHFMLPHDQWPAPIQPTDPRVKVVTLQPMDVYVRSFSGWAKDQDYTDQLMLLYNSLADKTMVDSSFFYMAGYDGPYQFANRHNEVWLKKTVKGPIS